MTNLSCDVKTCFYNESKCCCRHEIEVEGKGALNSDMTCCGSFREAKNTARNSQSLKPEKATDIKCDVDNCFYNDHHKCTADAINVSGCHACNCGQTECSTFRQR
ncbi:MAG: DUF1540 domain-containing protein [Lachnospiraceae bacterium]